MLLHKAGGHLSLFLLYVWVAEVFKTELVPKQQTKPASVQGNIVWHLSLCAGNSRPLQRWNQSVKKQCYVLEDRFAVCTHQLIDPATCIDSQTCGKPSERLLHKQTKMQGGNRSQHPLSLIICTATPHPEWSHFSQGKLWGIPLDFPPGLFKLYFPACIPLPL